MRGCWGSRLQLRLEKKGLNGERGIGETCLEEDLRMPLELGAERLKQRV